MNKKKYIFNEEIKIKCWICQKEIFKLKSAGFPIELELSTTPEDYDLELYCPDCKESCMYSFSEDNENYYKRQFESITKCPAYE
jgi:hypothetical protein